jgi:hypothetical protein
LLKSRMYETYERANENTHESSYESSHKVTPRTKNSANQRFLSWDQGIRKLIRKTR